MAMSRARRSLPAPLRREGFRNQKLVVLPKGVVQEALKMPMLQELLLVAAGFFPAAERHLVERIAPIHDAVVILCVGGRGWVRMGEEKPLAVEANTLIIVPPDEAHAYGADEVDPWSIYWAHIQGRDVVEFLKLFGGGGSGSVIRLSQEVVDGISFDEIYRRLEEDYTIPNLFSAAARLRLAFVEIHRLRGGTQSSVNLDPVERTIGWMRGHLKERVRLADLARRAGLSVTHYSAIFRRKTAYAPVDYFLRMKVQRACQLLDTTSMRIDEIAAAVGYDDPFYFSRLFRGVMAVSPRAYRGAKKG